MAAQTDREARIEENRRLLAGVKSAVSASLISDGYEIFELECQDWAAHFSVAAPNMDGSLDLFFGPIHHPEESSEEEEFSYRIVREETFQGVIPVPPGVSAEEIASRFLAEFYAGVIPLIQSSHSPSPEVGRGLLPAGEEEAMGDPRK